MVQQRQTVHFSGQVQGVGFRWTTRRVANQFQVTGYVQNLSDGRVRLIAEGAKEEVQAFVAEVQRQMQRYVSHVDQSSSPATGEFQHFEIRH